MFVSTDYLVANYGIDAQIAKFFVDREPPANNLYWKGKLLYLRPIPGFLTIPMIVDLLYKTGIDRERLLGTEFIDAMEEAIHYSALEETGQLSMKEAIEEYAVKTKPGCKDEKWHTDLGDFLLDKKENYITQMATPYKALHRGDIFLYAICVLDLPQNFYAKVVEIWFALITVILLFDDVKDIEEDGESGDENAFIESGLTKESTESLLQIAHKNLQKVAQLNVIMARQLQKILHDALQLPQVKKTLPEFKMLSI